MLRLTQRLSVLWPRHRGARIAAALVYVLVFAVATGELLGWRFLRDPLAGFLTRTAGTPVELGGDFRLHLLGPPRMRVATLHVGAGQEVEVEHLLKGEGVELRWRWSDAWRAADGGQIVIRRLGAERLDVHLVRLQDGRASWALGEQKPRAADGEALLPRVDALYVAQGQGELIDERSDTRLALTVHTDSDGQEIEATAKGKVTSIPLDLRARAEGALALVQDDEDAEDAHVRVEGKVGRSSVRFDGQAGGLLRAARLNGDLDLRGPSLAAVGDAVGITLPRTPPFILKAAVSHDGGVWQLDARKFVVGSSQLGGEFNLDTRAKPPLLKGELRGQRLFLSDLGPSIGVDSQSTGSAETPAGQRVLPNTKLDIPSLTAMNATVKVDIDKFDLDTKALAPLSKLQSELVLQDGSLALNDLRAIAPEGTLTGTTRLEGRGAAALWSADLALSGVELARWLLVKRTEPDGPPRPQPDSSATAPPQAYLTGKLAARLIVSGKGRSTAEILASMNGQADLSVRDGTVSHLVIEAFGLDLAQGLGLLLSGDDALPMRCMRLQVAVNDGVAMVQRGVLDNSDSTLVLTGGLSLRDETLNLKAVAKPKDMSLFTLRSPLRVTGSWSTPSIALEGDKLAARALAAVVLGSLAGPAALLPFVDLGTDSDTDPCIRTRSDL